MFKSRLNYPNLGLSLVEMNNGINFSCVQLHKLLIMISHVDCKEDSAGKYCVGMCIILFRSFKSRIKRDCLLCALSDNNTCSYVVTSLATN